MHSSSRQLFYGFALLIFLSGVFTTPGMAAGVAGSQDVTGKINEMAKRETVKPAVAVKPRMLDLKPLPAQRLARLTKEARTKYDEALGALDKINYDRAVDCMQQAVKVQPDDVYLRYQLVVLAQYMGDTRSLPDEKMAGKQLSAQDYYDIVIENLQAMSTSTMLNPREKQRAMDALETMTALRQSVAERETLRHKSGEEIAKAHSKEAFAAADKRERERLQKHAAVEEYVKTLNTPGLSVTAIKMNNSQRNSAPTPTRSTRSSGGY